MEATITKEEFFSTFQELMAVRSDADGFTGQVLDTVIKAARLPGEDYSDSDCLDLIWQLVQHWGEVSHGYTS